MVYFKSSKVRSILRLQVSTKYRFFKTGVDVQAQFYLFTFCSSNGFVTLDNHSSVSLIGSIPNLKPKGSLLKKCSCKNKLTASSSSILAGTISNMLQNFCFKVSSAA